MAIKSLKTEQGREIAWPEKLGQTRDTVTVTFAPRSSPSYQLFQRNTNTLRPTVASVSQQALVGGAFKMFQPDRKAFLKCLPRNKKNHQKHSCPLRGVEMGTVTIKNVYSVLLRSSS